MFNFLKRKPSEISRTNPGYEEGERKTPFVGIVLLLAMFVVGIYFGWQAVDDLSRIPDMPQPLSYCGNRYQTGFLIERTVQPYNPRPLYDTTDYSDYYGGFAHDYSKCPWSDLEKNYRIPELFIEKLAPLEKKRSDISTELDAVRSARAQVQNQLDQLTNQYSTGLQEKQAEIRNPVFPVTPDIQAQILALKKQQADLERQVADVENKLDTLQKNEIKAVESELVEIYKPVLSEQNTRLRSYEFKVFLLQFIFVFPFFLLVFWGYLRLHRKSSPYTVIFTAMVGVASVLFLRIMFAWFWGLFLARVLEVLVRWLENFSLFRSIVSYLGMLLAFIVFGGAVYLLQRKIFDPRRVTLRRFRAKQCPNCQTSLDLAVFYCPNCGREVKAKCASCGEPRFVGLPSCPHCGAKNL